MVSGNPIQSNRHLVGGGGGGHINGFLLNRMFQLQEHIRYGTEGNHVVSGYSIHCCLA